MRSEVHHWFQSTTHHGSCVGLVVYGLPFLLLLHQCICKHLHQMLHIQTIVKFHDDSPVAKSFLKLHQKYEFNVTGPMQLSSLIRNYMQSYISSFIRNKFTVLIENLQKKPFICVVLLYINELLKRILSYSQVVLAAARAQYWFLADLNILAAKVSKKMCYLAF